jgi:hypothetical protein
VGKVGTLSSLDYLRVDLRTSMKGVVRVKPWTARVDMRTIMSFGICIDRRVVVLSRCLLRVDMRVDMRGGIGIDMRTVLRVDTRTVTIIGLNAGMRTILLSGSLVADKTSRITLDSGTWNCRLK